MRYLVDLDLETIPTLERAAAVAAILRDLAERVAGFGFAHDRTCFPVQHADTLVGFHGYAVHGESDWLRRRTEEGIADEMATRDAVARMAEGESSLAEQDDAQLVKLAAGLRKHHARITNNVAQSRKPAGRDLTCQLAAIARRAGIIEAEVARRGA